MVGPRWSTQVVRRRWWVIAASLVGLVVSGVIASGTMSALSLSRFAAPGSESDRAAAAVVARGGAGSPNVALLVQVAGSVDDPAVAARGKALTRELAAWPGVRDAWSYWSEQADTMRSGDGSAAWVYASVPGDADDVRRDVLPALVDHFDVQQPGFSVTVAGADEVFRQVAAQSRADFVVAEAVIVPLILVLLWLIYRRIAAAMVTLGVGILAVVGALAILRGITELTSISTFAANIVLVLGVGLGVDYGLFMIFRFREALRAGASVSDAVGVAVRRAGRTVVFSGLTVAAALAALLAFPFDFLRSFAYAGIAVVTVAVLAAVTTLPAAMAVLGRRLERRQPGGSVEGTAWRRLCAHVMRRPVLWGGAALLVVAAIAAPAIGVRFGVADDRVLPPTTPIRAVYDVERAQFVGQDSDALLIALDTTTPQALTTYAEKLSRVEGVLRVDSAAGSFRDGAKGPSPPRDRFTMTPRGTWLSVTPATDRLDTDVAGLVTDVRAVPSPAHALVGGYPAELVDYRDGVIDALPVVVALIVTITFVVLFVMTGSLLLPIQATVLNLLSTAVMFGVLVWGFQHGALAGLLNFTPTGTLEPSIPILMFCITYGLSMDYEVFLLARITEEHRRGKADSCAVPDGIARSAPLVSAAALVLAATFAVYATGGVVFLKQIGIGLAVTVAADATLLRGVGLPALIRLSGRATWWAPFRLQRMHDQLTQRGPASTTRERPL